MAFVGREAEATERFGDATGAATLAAMFAHKEQHPGAARLVVDIPLPGGRSGGGDALALPVEQLRADGVVAVPGSDEFLLVYSTSQKN